MHQEDIEQLAFLYLCGERDREILNGKEKLSLADFDRLTYLAYYLGMENFHKKLWMRNASKFKKEFACLQELQKSGLKADARETDSEKNLHQLWIREFYQNASKDARKWLDHYMEK